MKPDSAAIKVSGLATIVHFLRNWAGNPLTTGAIAPSGSVLARRMASYISQNSDLPVLEIGPGTGSVTRALLDHGISPQSLIALEYNTEFCDHIRKNFPGVQVIQGDAYALHETLAGALGKIPKFRAVVSSMPLLTRPMEARRRFLLDCLATVADGAPVIQFSYGWKAPITPPSPVRLETSGWILRNIPPARVFVYR